MADEGVADDCPESVYSDDISELSVSAGILTLFGGPAIRFEASIRDDFRTIVDETTDGF